MFYNIARPKVLVWRSDAWKSLELSELAPAETQLETDLATLVEALKCLPKRTLKRCQAVLLPDFIAPVYCHDLDPSMPSELYPLAANTYADQSSALNSEERLVCSTACQLEPPLLHYSILSAEAFELLAEHCALPFFSETVVRASSEPLRLNRTSCFEFFQSDALERIERERARRRMSFGAVLIVVLTLGVLQWVKWQTPVQEQTFQWPWPEMDYQHQYFSATVNYLRSLPARVRLDKTTITATEVAVTVTGAATDVDTWQQLWPSQLPPLELEHASLNEEGAR